MKHPKSFFKKISSNCRGLINQALTLKSYSNIQTIILIYLFILIMPSNAESLNESQKTELFFKANQEYQEQKFSEAKDKYEKLINSGITNGYLFYNLGNCYFKLNSPGKARLYYLKAQKYIPRNKDLNANLNSLMENISDKTESSESSQIFKKIFFWYDMLSFQETLIIFLFLWSFTFLLIIIRIFIASEFFKASLFIFILLTSLFCLNTEIKFFQQNEKKAIVIVNESNVKSSTDINSITIFKVHQGAFLKITESSGNWSKIEFSKDKQGWIQNSSIESI